MSPRDKVLLLVLLAAVGTYALPTCVVANRLTAAGLRSADNRGLILHVYGDAIVTSSDPVLVSPATPLFVAQQVDFGVSETPPRITINFQQMTNYIGHLDSTVTPARYRNESSYVDLPSTFFAGGVSCSRVYFTVTLSPGTIDKSNIPQTTTEVDINTKDITFSISVLNDAFLTPAIVTLVRPSSALHLLGKLVGPAPSSTLSITIPRNDSYNLAYGSSEIITFLFNKENMQTGVAPLLDPQGFNTPVTLEIDSYLPQVAVNYSNVNGVLRAEDMWDGTAVVSLNLLGDFWITNSSLWSNPATMPQYTASQPVQPYAFQYFLNKGVLPRVTVTRRNVLLAFPAMQGFTLTNAPVTSLGVSGFDALATEHTSISDVSIRVQQAVPYSVRVKWSGGAFQQRLTEVDVRKSGLNFTAEIKYNIFSQPLNYVNLLNVIWKTTNSLFVESGISATLTGLTTLTLVFPAQSSYNIAKNDVFNLTIPSSITETQVAPTNPNSGFTVYSFKGASTCSLYAPLRLDETAIRDVSGPPLNLSLYISSGTDQFCNSSAAMDALMKSLTFTSTGANQIVTLTPIIVDSRQILFNVQKNVNFQISTDNFMSLIVPQSLMCSLEPCVASPQALSDKPTYLQISLRTTPGTLYATFPNITEVDMKNTDYSVLLTLSGDSFVSGATTSTFSFKPQFAVTPNDPNARAFIASILPGVTATTLNGNATQALLTIPHNLTYDCAATETISIVIDASLTASNLRPTIMANDFIINAVLGTIQSSILRNVTITEEDFLNGRFAFTVTLTNELWTTTNLIYNDLFASFAPNPAVGSSVAATISSWMRADDATTLTGTTFQLNPLRNVLTVNFYPAPTFDITIPESFTLTFSSISFASGMVPRNNSFTFYVVPSSGKVSISGSAVFAGTLQVVSTALSYVISLTNDLWDPTVDLVRSDFCVLTLSCSVFIDPSSGQRNVTVLFDTYPDFRYTTNKTFNITLPSKYFVSKQVPIGSLSLFIYVTSGTLSWQFAGQSSTTFTEDTIRLGTLPLITAGVYGDSFSVKSDVRTALAQGVSCVGANDAYGFCARAVVLFQTLDFSIDTTTNTMRCGLQADPLYDIYIAETVTLRLGSLAFQSRLTPNASYSLTFTVVPTRGQYFLSGQLSGFSEVDIRTAASARLIQMSVTVYGERWLANSTLALAALLPTIASSNGIGFEPRGWDYWASTILDPQSSATLDPTGRVLTLQFNPAPAFQLTASQTVVVAVGGSCVLSGLSPTLGGKSNTFVISREPGTVTVNPSSVSAATMRTVGVNVTIGISGAQWLTDTIGKLSLDPFITSSSTPIAEPAGFAKNRKAILSTVITRGFNDLTSNSFTMPLLPVSAFALNKPETLLLTPTTAWTIDNVSLSPTTITVRFDPDYPVVEAIVDTGTTNGVVYLSVWKSAVAKALGVSDSAIIVDEQTPAPEVRTSQPTRYLKIWFRVSYSGLDSTATNPIPYDNTALQTFLAFQSTFAKNTFNVVTAFYNNTPPTADMLLAIGNANAADNTGPAVGAGTIWLLAFAGVIVLVLGGVYGYLRFNAGKNRTSLRWASSKGSNAAEEARRRDIQREEAEQGFLEKAAEVVYAGQRSLVPVASGNSAQKTLKVDGLNVTVSASGIEDSLAATAIERDVPLMLYAGQASTAGNASRLPPSYLDRLEEHVLKVPHRQREWPSAPQPFQGRGVVTPVLSKPTPTADNIWADLLAEERAAEAAKGPKIDVDPTRMLGDLTQYRPSRFRTADHVTYSFL